MKTFMTLKVGYTSGMYGCSGEYFNTIIIWGNQVKNITFEGMYGAEERIAAALKARGFTQTYIRNDYGKMTKRDMLKIFVSEREALDTIKKMKKVAA